MAAKKQTRVMVVYTSLLFLKANGKMNKAQARLKAIRRKVISEFLVHGFLYR
jgi:hypothetical protein